MDKKHFDYGIIRKQLTITMSSGKEFSTYIPMEDIESFQNVICESRPKFYTPRGIDATINLDHIEYFTIED